MTNCIFCHKEKIVTDFIYEDDGFGWTYGNDAKDVNAEIAKRIRERLN